MKLIGTDEISFSGSFIIGWKHIRDTLIIDMELLLKSKHPKFEAFDKKKVVGCFQRGRLVCSSLTSVEGLDPANVDPVYDDKLGEYKDVYEIYEYALEGDNLTFDTDENEIQICGSEIRLELLSPYEKSGVR